jgi:hypothetical protein
MFFGSDVDADRSANPYIQRFESARRPQNKTPDRLSDAQPGRSKSMTDKAARAAALRRD